MKTTKISLVIGLTILFGCTGKTGQNNNADPSGVYVREYTFTVKNPETGRNIGMRTVRDTIFVKKAGDQYEISNHKWMMNGYDQDGWRSMEHADDRPFARYIADFDNGLSQLISSDGSNIDVDIQEEILYCPGERKLKFKKVK